MDATRNTLTPASEAGNSRDTIARFEETGSPVITDGEQRKPNFATYPIEGLEALALGV